MNPVHQQFENLSTREKEAALEMAGLWFWVKRGVAAALVATILLMSGCPPYNVWKDGLAGKAQLKQAEWNRQIAIKEGEAKKLAAVHHAEAEVERARGAAEANQILAASLGGSEGYLRWLYIDMMNNTKNQIIYIPTEAALPILEAGRR